MLTETSQNNDNSILLNEQTQAFEVKITALSGALKEQHLENNSR